MMGFKLSGRSESNLNGVDERLVKVIHRALEISSADFAVIEGLRTIEKQRENVRKGVSKTMDSRHLTGHAVDILPSAIKPGMSWELKYFMPGLAAIKQAGDELGVPLRFGLNWKNDPSLPIETKFVDAPHVEIPK